MKRGNWFKGVEKDGNWKELSKVSGRVIKRIFLMAGSRIKIKKAAATVVFVPSTRSSFLLKSLRDEEDKLAEMTGFRVEY